MNEKLQKALEEESKRFEEWYLWLEKSMPPEFFKQALAEWIPLIVHALMGFKVQDYFVDIHLRHSAIVLCFDSSGADRNILKSFPLHGIKNYTTFVSNKPLPFPDNPGLLRIALLTFTQMAPPDDEKKRFLDKLPPERRKAAGEILAEAETRDGCVFRTFEEESSLQLIMGLKNVPKHNFLYRLARLVGQHHLVMKEVDALYLHPHTTRSVLLLQLKLVGDQGQSPKEACDLADFLQEVALLKYFGSLDAIEETFVIPGILRGNLANLLRSMVAFIHQVLVHVDPHLYSYEHIIEGLTRLPDLTVKLCEAFELKFHPERHNLQKYQELRGELSLLIKQLDTGQEGLDERRKNVLLQAMNFIEHTLKTNFYVAEKTALGFRLDPKYLDCAPFEREKLFPELPYGIFFFKGMHHIAFHVRFRDLARGGLRTVFPEKKERVETERNHVFIECYNLAYTQQKKNKDIPEGGAKGVIFLKPDELLEEEAMILSGELADAGMENGEVTKRVSTYKHEQRLEYLYETQRSYIKTFLTLINCEESGSLRQPRIVDYWRRPEYIYLGPDENMHNPMIEWIAKESEKVGYKPGGAFISGKSKTGINHKEYGVTSLGVNVYMEEVLLYLGIDPKKERFTVKMTGGPDGDVGGNEIHNLFRFYPTTARLVALTDVSGTIFDPEGLDLQACDTLFHEEHPISHYPAHKLHAGGFLLNKAKTREETPYLFLTALTRNVGGTIEEEWLQGNEMNALFRYNVHRTPADIFIPCGGRPKTLRESNVEEFLDEGGMPTAKAIIEGANLYLTPWARNILEDKGVLIIKDSSANKCGVVSSSFEILAGLTLSDEEFVQEKPHLIAEILERLKKISLDEARLLLRTFDETHERLTSLSDQISERINHYTDQLLNYLDDKTLSTDPSDPLIRVLLNYCLPTLRKYQQRLIFDLPAPHRKAIIACHIASRVVYTHGLSWTPSLIEVLPLLIQEPGLLD